MNVASILYCFKYIVSVSILIALDVLRHAIYPLGISKVVQSHALESGKHDSQFPKT